MNSEIKNDINLTEPYGPSIGNCLQAKLCGDMIIVRGENENEVDMDYELFCQIRISMNTGGRLGAIEVRNDSRDGHESGYNAFVDISRGSAQQGVLIFDVRSWANLVTYAIKNNAFGGRLNHEIV